MQMKHKKLTAVLVLVCFLLTLMPVAAMAADPIVNQAMPQPTNVKWLDLNTATVCWDPVPGWNGMYGVRIHNTQTGHGMGSHSVNAYYDNNIGKYTFSVAPWINPDGEYEVEVFTAATDGTESDAVITEAKTFPLNSAPKLAVPQNPSWENGYATWDPVPGADGYTVEYYKFDSNGKKSFVNWVALTGNTKGALINGKVVENTGKMQNNGFSLSDSATYYFKVWAVSMNQSSVANSDANEVQQGVPDTYFKGKLGQVTGLQWSPTVKGDIEFYPVAMCRNGYRVNLYRDGELYSWGTQGYGYDGITGKATIPMSKAISDSGTYTLEIYAVGDGNYTFNGDPVAISEPFVYTKPEKILQAPNLVFWDYEKGYACWNAVDYADNYMVYIQVDGQQMESFIVRADENVFFKDGVKCHYGNRGRVLPDVTKLHQEGKEVTFMVRAQVDDITTFSSSWLSPTSPVFGNSQAVADAVNDDLKTQLLAAQADVKVGNTPQPLAVTDKTQMQQAMQDPAVMATMDAYEDLYKTALGVQVGIDTNGVTAPNFDVSKVQIQGAALNATTGGELTFKISDAKVDNLTYDHNTYTDDVQFLNLSLWNGEFPIGHNGAELDVPVRVTLPVPSNIAPDKLRILHYDNTGKSEVITPTLNADKTLASFVLLHFSDFALVELKDTNNNSNIGGGSSSGGGGVYAGPGSTGAGVTKPATPALTMKMKVNDKVITANGKNFTYDVAPIIVGDRTMVPVRVIMETLGAKVDWTEATRTVTITMGDKVMTMVIDQEIPGYGTAPFIQNDRTYVPIRYIMEKAGADVKWIAETGEIVITK